MYDLFLSCSEPVPLLAKLFSILTSVNMKTLQLAALSLAGLLAAGAAAKEVPPNDALSQVYDAGVPHEALMRKKAVSFLTYQEPPRHIGTW